MEEKAIEKETFFKELYQLDDDSDEEPVDSYDAASILRHSKAGASSHGTPSLPTAKDRFLRSVKASTPLARTTSAPLPSSKTPLAGEVDVVKDTPSLTTPAPRRIPEPIERTTSSPAPNGSRQRAGGANNMAKVGRKRKRGQSLDMMPESQQIFKGLGFCTTFHAQ